MPKVPTYNPNQVREERSPFVPDRVQVSRESLGGGASAAGVFKAVGGLAEMSSEFELAARKRVSDTQFLEGDSALSKLQVDTMSLVKNTRGKNALESDKIIKDTWQKGVDDLLIGYEDQNTKARINQAAQARYDDIYRDTTFHVSGELKKYEDETHTSYVANARDEAVFNYRDQEKVDFSIWKQEQAILSIADKNNWPPEKLKEELDNSASNTHLQVFTRILNDGDDRGAKQYHERVKSQLSGKDAATSGKLLEDATLRGESQRSSDKIVGGAKDMSEAMEQARGIDDPKLRDETATRVKQYYSDKKLADDRSTEDLHKRAANFIDKTPDIDTYITQNPADWNRFSLSERSSLKSYAAKRRQGSEPETSWADYYNIKTMASTPATRDKFLKTNLMEYRSKMADSEFKELVKEQTAGRSGRGISKEFDGYRTDSMIVNDALNSAGFDPSPKHGSNDAESVARFKSTVDQQIKQQQDRTGKKASNEDVQGIVDNMLVEVVTKPGFIFDTKKRVFELDPGEQGAISIGAVPRIERQKIESALKSRNMPVTEDKIIEMYSEKLKGIR